MHILNDYLNIWTIIITSNNGHALNMTANDYALLKEKLGLRILQDNVQSDSYIAVIEQGRLMYETLSNRKVEYNTKIESSSVDLCSSGWFDSPYVSTKINGIEYVQGGRGLNFVIYDYKTGLVIDSVSFDTFQASMPATRNWDVVETYLRAYESKVCFGEDAA